MSVCRIEAPCKINLHLKIKEKTSGGFHELESLFAALDFSDSIEFELTGKKRALDFALCFDGEAGFYGKLKAREEVSRIPSEKNLVCRAISLFREKTGFDGGIRAILTKRVPTGAGLGGGSSDAASALIALDFLTGTRLPAVELLEMASLLGSDVPFFMEGGAAWVSGRGEKMEKTAIKADYSVLLVKPDFSVSTAEAFRMLDKGREGVSGRSGALNPGKDQKAEKTSFFKEDAILSRPPSEWPFFNDFLPVLPGARTFADICSKLKDNGASFSGLSGSGSCCFGIFTDRFIAEKAYNYHINSGYLSKLTFFLAQRPCPVLD